jgi:hypothetical protein
MVTSCVLFEVGTELLNTYYLLEFQLERVNATFDSHYTNVLNDEVHLNNTEKLYMKWNMNEKQTPS